MQFIFLLMFALFTVLGFDGNYRQAERRNSQEWQVSLISECFLLFDSRIGSAPFPGSNYPPPFFFFSFFFLLPKYRMSAARVSQLQEALDEQHSIMNSLKAKYEGRKP